MAYSVQTGADPDLMCFALDNLCFVYIVVFVVLIVLMVSYLATSVPLSYLALVCYLAFAIKYVVFFDSSSSSTKVVHGGTRSFKRMI